MTVTGTTLRVDNLRGYAQGEIFLLKTAGEHLEATVYNTTGFGPVPAAEFDAIDMQRLAAANELQRRPLACRNVLHLIQSLRRRACIMPMA